MRELCHRCHGELPESAPSHRHSGDDALLFCPRCSAPQILLPEHMRVAGDAAPSAEQTTGTLPPPRLFPSDPRAIEWRAALTAGLIVSAIAAVLRIISLSFDAVSILWFFWIVSGASIAISLYGRRRPQAWMDARNGMRIGLVTGVLMCALMSLISGTAGVIMRYSLHSMAQFDQQSADDTRLMQARVQAWMKQQNFDGESQKNYADAMNSPMMQSPEFRAGSALVGFGFEGALLLLATSGFGALNGMMRGARLARQRREP